MKKETIFYIILLTIIAWLLAAYGCKKEYSCEGIGCREDPIIVDTIIPPDTISVDTVPQIDTSTYYITYDILVENNNQISHVEVQYFDKQLQKFITFEIINHVDDSTSYHYIQTFDITWIMEEFVKGEVVNFRYAKVSRRDRYTGEVTFEYSEITHSIIKR